jgi:glucose-1-phosphate adenylyltransferase
VDNVITAILGGGQGSRLWPLTQYRAKPAVPVAGTFRLIDIPISNSLHAGIDRIYVMTQFNSTSLHRHIAQTFRFDNFSRGFVNILAAAQNLDRRGWYQGTADAVRQNLDRLAADPSTRDIVILSGDQLYLMNLRAFVEHHRGQEADLTIAVKPVSRGEASGFGIMRLDREGRIVEFVEKPQDEAILDRLTLDDATAARLGADPGTLLASMGIYTFKRDVLREVLEIDASQSDFGKEIIPAAIAERRVFAFLYDGYWRDIGTVPAFHQANLELTREDPPLNLYHPDYPIYTHARFLPGLKISRCEIEHSVLCEGSVIAGSAIRHSVIGIRSLIGSGSIIEESIIMGTSPEQRSDDVHRPGPIGIGHDCHIRRAIIDRGARIGDGSRLLNTQGVQEADGESYCIRGGIIVVPSHAVIAPGTII